MMINRSAIVVRYRNKFTEWANEISYVQGKTR